VDDTVYTVQAMDDPQVNPAPTDEVTGAACDSARGGTGGGQENGTEEFALSDPDAAMPGHTEEPATLSASSCGIRSSKASEHRGAGTETDSLEFEEMVYEDRNYDPRMDDFGMETTPILAGDRTPWAPAQRCTASYVSATEKGAQGLAASALNL